MDFSKKQILSRRSFLRVLFIMVLVLNFSLTTTPARAGVWGESIAATLLNQTLDMIKRQLEGAILGTLKVAAISVLNSQVGQMIGGTTLGDALFISDWEDFLYRQPAEKVRVQMNDFFTLTLRGKSATSNYVGVGDTPGSVAGNYPTYLKQQAESALAPTELNFAYNLDNYTNGNEFALFNEGDYRGLNAYFSNPANTPSDIRFQRRLFIREK